MGYRSISTEDKLLDLAAEEYEVIYKVMDIKNPLFAVNFEVVTGERELGELGFRYVDELPF